MQTRSKTAYLHALRLRWFLDRHPICYLCTLTFAENVTRKATATKRFKAIAYWLRRRGVQYVVTWQRQARGAWHAHLVLSERVNVVNLRSWAVAHGWGKFVNVRPVEQAGNMLRYLVRYLTRDMEEAAGARMRVTGGSVLNRVGTVRFNWQAGRARLWRFAVAPFVAMRKRLPTWRDSAIVEALIGSPIFTQWLAIGRSVPWRVWEKWFDSPQQLLPFTALA